MGGKRMPLSKDARKYRKQVDELKEVIEKLNKDLERIPELEAQLEVLDETRGELAQVQAKLEATAGQMKHLEKVHERDVKARTSANMKMKNAVRRADRYQRLNKDMGDKLMKANQEIERLMKIGRENVVLQHEMKKVEFHKEQTAAKLAKEEEAATLERQYRLKELFTHEQTLEELEEQKRATAKERERTAEVQRRVEELKKELIATQVQLDQQQHTHEVRVSALHMQRDEIARLKDLITHLRQDISVQRGEINMWSTRYKRLRDGFRVLQARLAKTVRATNSNPTQTQKGQLVSPPESSLLLLANEMAEVIAADAHTRSKSDTHSFSLKRRELEYPDGVSSETLRQQVREARITHSAHGRLSQTAPQLLGKRTLPPRTRQPATGSHAVLNPPPPCERTELPAYQRKVLPDAKGSMGRSLTDSYLGVGPGTMMGTEHSVTAEGYVIAGDGSSTANFGSGVDVTAAMDAVTGAASSAKADFYDTRWLQDDAMVVGIMEAERKEIARERKRRQSAARRIRRVGKARPPGPPSEEAGANGSLYVGRGLGIRKEAPKNENGGSVRQVLARILSNNPEVARLRKLEQSKLPF